MKQLSTVLCFLLGSLAANAQAMDTNVEFNKNVVPGASVDLSYPSGTVEDAVKEKMRNVGYKASSVKSFIVFRNVIDSSLNSQVVDIFLKIDKVRGEKDKSNIQMVTAIRDSIVASPGATKFLNSILPFVDAYSLNLNIKSQEETVSKAQKKFDNLVDDSVSLVKKIRNLNEDLVNNRKKRQEQQAEVDRQKATLETLRSRRKN
jgi:hypothetical protein